MTNICIDFHRQRLVSARLHFMTVAASIPAAAATASSFYEQGQNGPAAFFAGLTLLGAAALKFPDKKIREELDTIEALSSVYSEPESAP